MQCVLEGLGGILEPHHELLRKSFCHQPPDDVADNNSSDLPISLQQGCHLAHSQGGDTFFGKFRLCESLGSFEELGAILSIVEKCAQMLVAHARRPSCCSPTCGSQIWRNSSLSNSRGLKDLISSGMGSLGHGGCLSLSLRAFKVSSVTNRANTPKSPHVQLVCDCVMLGASPSRTQLAEASKLSLRRSNHSPDANFWTRSTNLFLVTLPPFAADISCNATRMAARYAPLKNAGGAFITQAVREKMSWTGAFYSGQFRFRPSSFST